MMQKRTLILVLTLVAAVLAGLGYFMFFDVSREPGEAVVTKQFTEVEEAAPSEGVQAPPEAKKQTLAGLFKEEANPDGTYTELYCTQIEEGTADFFSYLDEKQYVKHLHDGKDGYTSFRKIIRKLSARPPIPAGEGIDPRIIIENVYYLFRILARKDLRLIEEVVLNEQDSIEFNLNMFYRWFTLGSRCPDRKNFRPSNKALYQYAGYFLNTIGGRAYLFRRSEPVRLLVTYYSLLIVHEADRAGRNDYGIDLVPFIEPLKNGISYYPKFEFQTDYIDRLNEIQDHYLRKR